MYFQYGEVCIDFYGIRYNLVYVMYICEGSVRHSNIIMIGHTSIVSKILQESHGNFT